MRKILKKYSGVIYIAAMTIVVGVVLGCSGEMGQIINTLKHLKKGWIAAAAGMIVVYLFLRMATARFFLSRHGVSVSWRTMAGMTGAGQFYSAITPSASGGQPMQVLCLSRRGVPASLGTACVSVKFLGFQAAFLLLGGALWLMDLSGVERQLYGLRWLVILGFVVNAGLLVAVLLTALQPRMLDGICRMGVRIGAKLRLVKRPEEAVERFRSAVREYCDALLLLLRRPTDALAILGLSLLQVLAYMSVIVCLYHAFELDGASVQHLLTIQLLLFTAAAFVPLPGAAGVQESGFCAFFRGIFPDAKIMAAMLIWRFFSYYLLMILGLIMMAVGGARKQE